MLLIDDIIYSLQKMGGISVYFNEIITRLLSENYAFSIKSNLTRINHSRLFERYRNFDIGNFPITHSSYYRINRNSQTKNVTTVHDFTYEKFTRGLKRSIHSIQKFHSIRKSDKIICISQNTKNDLLNYLPEIDENRIHVIYNGVSSLFFPIPEKETTYPPYILFVGARSGYKNFMAVVVALSGLTDFHLKVVGGGNFSRDELISLDKLIPNRFQHMGLTSTDKLNQLYNHAFALVYPSSYEGFGIPILEAMRAGCPVVAINASSIPEVAGNASILLEEANPDLIRNSILVLQSKEIRQRIITSGHDQSSRFSWDNTFKNTLSIYEELNDGPLEKLSNENITHNSSL